MGVKLPVPKTPDSWTKWVAERLLWYPGVMLALVSPRLPSTSVRLDIEKNELVSVAVQVRFEIVCCKAHEICVFSKMETERICRQV